MVVGSLNISRFLVEDREKKKMGRGFLDIAFISMYRKSDEYSALVRTCSDRLDEIVINSAGRDLIIWGCGHCGIACFDVLSDAGFSIRAFVDRNFKSIGSFLGKHVWSIQEVDKNKHYVIAAINSFDVSIEKTLIELGLSDKDYVHVVNYSEYIHEDIVYKGIPVGRYTYGYKHLLQDCPMARKIGRYCSINKTARIWNNHPVDFVTTSPILDHRGFSSSYSEYLRRRDFCNLYGIYNHNHSSYDSPIRDNRPVEIGNDVWIGANVVILPGVKISDGAILAAGAVVTHDVEPYAIVGGVPAKLIKKRFSDEDIHKLLSIAWWDWKQEQIEENMEFFFQPQEFIKMFFSK